MSRRLLLPCTLLLCLCFMGCAAKKEENLPPVPLPPQATLAALPERPAPALEQGQTIIVTTEPDLTASPRQSEPQELAALLEMKGTLEKETAVNLMRPSAIREAAQLVTFQTAMAWRYKQLVAATEAHSGIMDAAFNFGRYDNPEVTAALNTYANAASDEERTAALEVIQTAYVEDIPAITLGAHPLLGQYNTRNYVGWPDEDNPYASGDPTQPNIVLILQRLQVK